MTIQFASRVASLPDPYSPPKPANPPRLDLRDVVPDFTAILGQKLGSYPKKDILANAIAEKYNLQSQNVLVTAGGDDALCQIILSVIEPGTNLVVTTPTFGMIQRYVTLAGGEMKTTQRLTETVPENEFTSLIDDNTRLILFISPNNPTGQTVPIEIIRRIREYRPDILIVLDGVYTEFADQDITNEFLALPNTMMVRSFSKAYGAAALRLGYALSLNLDVLIAMQKVAQPYSVSNASIEFGIKLLSQDAVFKVAAETIRKNRALLFSELQNMGYTPLASEANFLFFPCASFDAARKLFGELDSHGIAIRIFPDDPLIMNYVRIGVPYADADLTLLISTLKEISI